MFTPSSAHAIRSGASFPREPDVAALSAVKSNLAALLQSLESVRRLRQACEAMCAEREREFHAALATLEDVQQQEADLRNRLSSQLAQQQLSSDNMVAGDVQWLDLPQLHGRVAVHREAPADAASVVSGGAATAAGSFELPALIRDGDHFRALSQTQKYSYAPKTSAGAEWVDQSSCHKIPNDICWRAYQELDGHPGAQRVLLGFAHSSDNILYSAHNKDHSRREVALKNGTATAEDIRLKAESIENALCKLAQRKEPGVQLAVLQLMHVIREAWIDGSKVLATFNPDAFNSKQQQMLTSAALQAAYVDQQAARGRPPKASAAVAPAPVAPVVYVSAYTRADGTPVKAHTRSAPNSGGSTQQVSSSSSSSSSSPARVSVSAYVRADGTPVKAHTRAAPSAPASAPTPSSSSYTPSSSSRSSSTPSSGTVSVSGYTRANGTYVSGYTRSSPGSRSGRK